jgi:DNA (cytosine-5)-methyltransferase 1
MTNLTVTDLFAGAGGSSTGMVQVPGVHVRYAANHWALACETHNLNHPNTDHAVVDLHLEDPRYFARTDILWASPECKKWSQANGTELPAIEAGLFEDPLSDEAKTRSRLLMFDVLRFVEHHRYRMVIVENVVDIATQAKYRLAWYEWRTRLRALGYQFKVVSLNSMHAQLLGAPAPQSRDRVYIVAWPEAEKAPDLERVTRTPAWCPKCDQVVEGVQSWKNGKTVGKYRTQYVFVHAACGTVVEPGWLPAASAIDWSIRGERFGDRKRADKTRLRVARGIARYWGPLHIEATANQYDAADPNHPQYGQAGAYYRAWPISEPIRTLHTRESKALVVPSGGTWNEDARPATDPHRTLLTRDAYGLACVPLLDHIYGTGQAYPATNPAATFTADGNHHALIDTYYGNSGAHPVDHPLGTQTTHDRHALVMRNNNTRGDQASMSTPAAEEFRALTCAGHQSVLRPGELDLGLIEQPRDRRRKPTEADVRRAEEMVDEVLYRMLRPHEVAAGMAFPADYRWDAIDPKKGRPASGSDVTEMAGNAVTPPSARDLMAAAYASITGEDVAA